jgi:hypothetical protein
MPTTEFLQLIVVALVAGYVGYLLGRASAKASGSQHTAEAALPGPDMAEAPAAPTPRRSSAPPPAGAGGSAANPGNERAPPRRSSAPPPAAAGLMKRDDE